ncbi:MAG: HAD family hydrolase [Gemmatimonadetes bacterium]|nr:HAD family hydrolase [Gemmatimonadota bacterium]
MTVHPGSLLASDLDGTLIPPEDSPSHQGALTQFARVVERARPGLALAYVTGRDLGMALAGVERWALPVPDFMACDVGTTIYHRRADGFVVDDGYAERMRDAFGGIAAADVLGVLEDLPQVRAQPAANQAMHKASFFFPWDEWGLAEPAVSRRLADSGVRADLVVSRDLVTGDGLLDVVPAGGGKGRAVTYLADLLELSLDRVVFAGDSGNDREALLSGVRSVLVGNAPARVRSDLREEARARRLDDRVYLAEGEGAEGVMEGLVHWGVVPG